MEATNAGTFQSKTQSIGSKNKSDLPMDKINLESIKYAQGLGASLRYANELHAVKQVGRLPFLTSSRLHEDVLKGNLGPSCGLGGVFTNDEEQGKSRLSFL